MAAIPAEHLSSAAPAHGGRTLVRGAVIVGAIVLASLACHAIAVAMRINHPDLASGATLSFLLGLRHAVDCDHLAAIDNVTRQLMLRAGGSAPPVSVGFWFALGHSTIVMLLCAALAAGYTWAFHAFQNSTGVVAEISTFAGFLSAVLILVIGLLNAQIAVQLCRSWRSLRKQSEDEQSKALEDEAQEGLRTTLSAIPCLQRIFRLVDKPEKMYMVGFMFGLSFDSATQVGLLGLAAMASARQAMPPWMVALLPISFSCGMCLVDTVNGLLMLATYSWATIEPMQKLVYNMTVTSLSAVIAISISMMEFLQIIAQEYQLSGAFWDALLSINMATVGYGIIATFLVAFVASIILTQCSKARTPKGLEEPLLAV
mmetsp:Transcript_52863/g.126243  ORF Transcript_52863/g.126243 Transcript_52863/m.126243 type:complete len:372 (-) Transcript_52863:82-1197(-)